MRIKTMLLSAALFLLFIVGQASANTTGDAPTSGKQRVVNYTRFLESNPLHEKAPAMRSALISLVSEIPDVTVVVCDILGPIPHEHLPYGPELLLQSLFGNASYQIENPDNKDVTVSAEIAGVESALKAYSSIIAIHKEAKIPYFDDSLKKEQDGSLRDFMAPIVTKKCSSSSANKQAIKEPSK